MAELVSSAHARCFFAFESFIRALKQPARDFQDQIPLTDIHNEFDKYTVWAGNVGAAHSGKRYEISLDYRLREASFLKERVLKLLSTLEERVSTAAGLVRGERKPFEEEQIEESDSEVSTSSDLWVDLEGGKESEDSPWEISSDSSNGDGSSSQHRQTHQQSDEPRASCGSSSKTTERPGLSVDCSPISEMLRLVESIKLTITCLYRLPIRKPAPLDRIKHKTSIASAVYQHFDVLYVKDKFPNLQPQAATRLGKMITRRRQILYYREAHKQSLDVARVQPKIAPVLEALPTSSIIESDPKVTVEDRGSQAAPSQLALSQAASSHFTLHSKATTVRPGELKLPVSKEYMDTLFAPSVTESKSSMASSYAGKDIRIDVPSRPKNDDGQELEWFECPYCLLTKNISNDRKWKKHVLEDLQPYVCTYGDCELYDHFFDSRDAWFKHEAQHHRTKWSCYVDSHPEYDSEENFLLHMRADHDQKFDEAQFSLVKSMFRQPTKSLEGTCNLCHRQSKNLRSHLSRHLQQIAIFALPRVNETAGSGHAERDSRSSRYKKDGLDDGESSGSSSSSTGVLSNQQPAPNDFTSGACDIEDYYDEGENIPDAVEDQVWDNVTDKFSKARKQTFRRLRVLILEIKDEDGDKIASLIERLRCEPIVIVDYHKSAANIVRNHTPLDVIIIGDIYGSTMLDTSIRQIRNFTDIPIIIVRKSASTWIPLLDFSNWTEFVEPSQGDIEEALGSLCQWAPAPPHWRLANAQYEMTGSTEDLEAAILQAEIAVSTTPEDHPDRAARLSSLGSMLFRRYERIGNMEDLEAAILQTEIAVTATPGNHPGKAARLSNLGSMLFCQYERTGNIKDLEVAILQAKTALSTTPEDHPDRAARLSNLKSMLFRQYERTGSMEDLEVAISQAKKAVYAAPEGHPDRAARLSNLGSMLFRRYERIGNMEDLEAAILQMEIAVTATPGDYPGKAARLSNLGSMLFRHYERTGNMGDLEVAILQAKTALSTTPEDHPDQVEWRSNLRSMYFAKQRYHEFVGTSAPLSANSPNQKGKSAIIAKKE